MAIGWWRSSWGWKVWDSHSRWRLSLDVVTWSDATTIGSQHRPNARYPAPLWPRSTRKSHKPYSAIITERAICVHRRKDTTWRRKFEIMAHMNAAPRAAPDVSRATDAALDHSLRLENYLP